MRKLIAVLVMPVFVGCGVFLYLEKSRLEAGNTQFLEGNPVYMGQKPSGELERWKQDVVRQNGRLFDFSVTWEFLRNDLRRGYSSMNAGV